MLAGQFARHSCSVELLLRYTYTRYSCITKKNVHHVYHPRISTVLPPLPHWPTDHDPIPLGMVLGSHWISLGLHGRGPRPTPPGGEAWPIPESCLVPAPAPLRRCLQPGLHGRDRLGVGCEPLRPSLPASLSSNRPQKKININILLFSKYFETCGN